MQHHHQMMPIAIDQIRFDRRVLQLQDLVQQVYI
jgi:hypothetical protein